MRLSDAQTKRLLEYEGKLEIKQLVLSLSITKNRMKYNKDKSPSNLSSIAKDINAIIEKYEISTVVVVTTDENIKTSKISIWVSFIGF